MRTDSADVISGGEDGAVSGDCSVDCWAVVGNTVLISMPRKRVTDDFRRLVLGIVKRRVDFFTAFSVFTPHRDGLFMRFRMTRHTRTSENTTTILGDQALEAWQVLVEK